MNQDRQALVQLIKAMKGNEKRYFTRFSSVYNTAGQPPLYMQLFRLIENDNNEISNQFRPTSLSTTKKLLYKNILKSLRLFHHDSSINQKLQGYLSDIENLYNLGLASQALIPLNKAFGIVYRFEKFGYLFQVLDWEKRLNIVLVNPTRSEEEIKNDEETALRQLSQIKGLENIYGRIMAFKKQYGFVKGEIRELVKSQTVASMDMPDLEDCLSKKAIYYHNFIHAIYHWMIFEHEKSYTFSQKLLFDDNSSILPNDYINGILQHITSSVCLAKFKDTLLGISFAQVYIEEYRLNQSAVYNTLVFAYHATYKLVVHMYIGNKKQLKETINYVSDGLERHGSTIQPDMKQIIMGNLIVAYMAVHDYAKVDKAWNMLFNRQSQQIRQDVYADLYLFRLFKLLHEKQYELLPSAALTACRFFEKSGSYKEEEYPISALLLKERNYNDKKVLAEVIAAIRQIIANFITKVSGSLRFQEHYSRYLIWCDAIENDEPFYKAAGKWYKSFLADNNAGFSSSKV